MQCSRDLFVQPGQKLISDMKMGFPHVSQHGRKHLVIGFASYGRTPNEAINKIGVILKSQTPTK